MRFDRWSNKQTNARYRRRSARQKPRTVGWLLTKGLRLNGSDATCGRVHAHSYLRAVIGSTLAPRTAGTRTAIMLTLARKTIVPIKTAPG
jgi:hypothetical protein